MKKFGFTLAEILVTMSVVGIISALTIPTLINNTTESQIGPKLAKAVSTFEQANESLLNARASDTLTDAGLVSNKTLNGYIANLSIFLKLTPKDDKTFVTKDNMRFNITPSETMPNNGASPAYQQRVGTVIIDIDASNGERMATDTFRFSWWNDGSLRPQGGTNWNGGVIVCSKDSNGNCITDENNNDIMEENARDIVGGAEHWQTQCAKDAIPTNPEYCAGHIFENNLKVLYK